MCRSDKFLRLEAGRAVNSAEMGSYSCVRGAAVAVSSDAACQLRVGCSEPSAEANEGDRHHVRPAATGVFSLLSQSLSDVALCGESARPLRKLRM